MFQTRKMEISFGICEIKTGVFQTARLVHCVRSEAI